MRTITKLTTAIIAVLILFAGCGKDKNNETTSFTIVDGTVSGKIKLIEFDYGDVLYTIKGDVTNEIDELRSALINSGRMEEYKDMTDKQLEKAMKFIEANKTFLFNDDE